MSRTQSVLAFGSVIALALAGIAFAEMMPAQPEGPPPGMQHMMPQQDPPRMPMMMHHPGMHEGAAGAPTMPGQAAFGAVQEVVRLLEADSNTDWSKVNLSALREHLIDMNEVTLRAAASERLIEGGLGIAVTGGGRTLEAIQHMLPVHLQEINGLHGWAAKSSMLPDGVLLTVTSTDPREVTHIRGLGFVGILVSGSHHQRHHLAMARSEWHGH